MKNALTIALVASAAISALISWKFPEVCSPRNQTLAWMLLAISNVEILLERSTKGENE